MMKRGLAVLVAAWCAWLLATPAAAQSGEWEALNKEVESLYAEGEYDRAVVVAKKALGVAEKERGSDHPDVALSLNNLALLYNAQGQYAAAEPLYKRSIAILEKALGPDHPNVATSLNNLSELYKKMGKTQEAATLAARAAKIQALKR